MRVNHEIPIESGQKFQVDRFKPADATGIANLFYAIYGPDYPFDTYYIPERIIEENHRGNIHSVVARTPKGDIVAHGALYRSSPVSSGLFEIGQYIVLKNYRETFAAYKINQYISESLTQFIRADGIFGEAVCNHVTTQKSSALIGMKDVALEVDLMPAGVYEKETGKSGRVSCLMQFRSSNDRPHEVFIPQIYRESIERILEDCSISRTIKRCRGSVPSDCESDVRVKYFGHAGVARANVVRMGPDFESVLNRFEKKAVGDGIIVFQLFINLDAPWNENGVELLRERGYFLGGYVPRWFDTDGLLMQKVFSQPDFDGINLYSEKARQIKEYVRADWDRAGKRAESTEEAVNRKA